MIWVICHVMYVFLDVVLGLKKKESGCIDANKVVNKEDISEETDKRKRKKTKGGFNTDVFITNHFRTHCAAVCTKLDEVGHEIGRWTR